MLNFFSITFRSGLELLAELYIYIYIYIYNIVVLVKICRFKKTGTRWEYLFRCLLSSMLPLRSVGRSNGVKVCADKI